MSNNLPPGVTPADIDHRFGPPRDDEVIVYGTVEIAVSAAALSRSTSREKRELLREAAENGDWEQIIEAHIEHEEPA